MKDQLAHLYQVQVWLEKCPEFIDYSIIHIQGNLAWYALRAVDDDCILTFMSKIAILNIISIITR